MTIIRRNNQDLVEQSNELKNKIDDLNENCKLKSKTMEILKKQKQEMEMSMKNQSIYLLIAHGTRGLIHDPLSSTNSRVQYSILSNTFLKHIYLTYQLI